MKLMILEKIRVIRTCSSSPRAASVSLNSTLMDCVKVYCCMDLDSQMWELLGCDFVGEYTNTQMP
jgi:hypothetical protein